MSGPGDAADDNTPSTSNPQNDLPHLPRKKAMGPRFDALPEFKASIPPPPPPPPRFSQDAATKIAELKEPRMGPTFVKYSLWSAGAAVAYTYLSGFWYLIQKNKPAWENTFRQRLVILPPVVMLYMTGTGLIPMPFKTKIEDIIGRPAISSRDFEEVEKQRKAAAAAAAAAQQQQQPAADN